MGERLPCKQEVTSSTLVFSTRITDCALHSPFFCILGKSFPNIQKRSARDAHCGVQGRCRKRPPQAPECAKAHSLLLYVQSQAIKDRLCYLVLARKYYSLSLIMWRIRHSDEMRSILELLDKEKSDKLCQIYATKKHPTARNL